MLLLSTGGAVGRIKRRKKEGETERERKESVDRKEDGFPGWSHTSERDRLSERHSWVVISVFQPPWKSAVLLPLVSPLVLYLFFKNSSQVSSTRRRTLYRTTWKKMMQRNALKCKTCQVKLPVQPNWAALCQWLIWRVNVYTTRFRLWFYSTLYW